MLKNFTPRLYQETILGTCISNNCMVVLPTGMGKTAIAMMLAVHRLNQYPESKILFVAPTKPLVDQHLKSFKNFIDADDQEMVLFTGAVKPTLRHEQFKSAKFIFSTPQGLENDIISKKIDLSDVSLLVVDECHRAVGDYAYVFLAKQFERLAKKPKILALTASPGSEMEKIEEVCRNLHIDAVEIKTAKDPDVKPYVKEINTKWVRVTLPPSFLEIKKLLDKCVLSKLKEMEHYGFKPKYQYLSKRELLAIQGQLHGKMASGERDFETLKALSLIAEAMKAHHALELLESQGISPLIEYFKKTFSDAAKGKTKAVQNLVRDINYKSAFIKAESLFEKNFQHPKLEELRNIVEEEVFKKPDVKIILFTQYRDSASNLKKELEKIDGVIPKIFVGQAKKGNTGLSQKKQIEMLQEFRDGLFNVLIATSVAEEGLDIPAVDLVMFYEPIPSAIRTIQRRGRTGRQEEGRVIIMMATGTRDEGYHWSAKHKEKRMYKFLDELKTSLNKRLALRNQRSLSDYAKKQPEENPSKIFVDYREKGSHLVKQLIDAGVNINLEMLGSADFVLSSRCAVEFKNTQDFVDSIVDGRLLKQLKDLKSAYERPIVLVEGEEDIYSLRSVHPNAIRGMIATVSVSFGIPILFTRNHVESADLLMTIAKREQSESGSDFSLHSNKKSSSIKEQQEYLISALPNIGPSAAKALLEHFGSISKIFSASESDFLEVEKIGKKKASDIKKLIDADYKFV